ncbi:PREDICTED: COP9 signalosome complex subunit 8 [Tarenaya hassleriana]|uniref:COP9 signalosome complex subunit 8 n=1 Tax=Tarenaya hassleriana TaxID=28532 RepID=UPI00053C4C6D|nr:PREDICTED: COP9 signalosome complex subunit 8 [Tarenaya hassleriana]
MRVGKQSSVIRRTWSRPVHVDNRFLVGMVKREQKPKVATFPETQHDICKNFRRLSSLHGAKNRESHGPLFDQRIADLCDNFLIQVAAGGIPYHEEWPYAIHLLGHTYTEDINSARFLWKTLPRNIKESRPELVAAWNIGQKLWRHDYAGVYEDVRGYDWSPEAKDIVVAFSDIYTRKMFQLLSSAYSSITIRDMALSLGMTEADACDICNEGRVECGFRICNGEC